MKLNKDKLLIPLIGMVMLLSACDQKQNPKQESNAASESVVMTMSDKAEVLAYLNLQEQPAKLALPFCETKNCIDIDVQTLSSTDTWLNQWIEKQQALVIQDQIGLKQDMRLQQAINAYVKNSDAWQEQLKLNQAYSLAMYTRIPYQRNQYVLLQIGVDTDQENIQVKERYYFYVADRRTQKNLTPLDVIDAKKQVTMDKLVQSAYQDWLKKQSSQIQHNAPKKLYWGQANWFFDQEGMGLHYHGDDITTGAKQLDIYLTKEQTQQVLKAEIYPLMF